MGMGAFRATGDRSAGQPDDRRPDEQRSRGPTEREFPTITRYLAIAALAAAALVAPALAAAHGGDNRLVLVASASSPLGALTTADVRRLYLGIPRRHAGREINALRNAESPVVKEMFLQHVLFMSSQAYERRLSARVHGGGGSRVPEFKEPRALMQMLAADPHAVTYMQSGAAARRPGIRILAEL